MDNSDLPPGLASPAQRALAAAGITRLVQLTELSEAELLKLHGMGPKALQTLREAMNKRGLKFSDDDETTTISKLANKEIERRKPKNNG